MIENKIQTEVKKSRRGLPRHTKNPFLNDTSLHTKLASDVLLQEKID